MNFYPHHISDFNNATRHLTRVERSVYRDLIELYYDTENVLTKDFEKLARKILATSDEEKTALRDVLTEFFTLNDDGYFHDRCDAEIAKYRANTSAKARAGIASAAARKQKSTRVQHVLNTRETHEQLTNNQEPLTNNIKPTCEKSHFDDFWNAYPNIRKVAKKNCLEKWKAKKLDAIAEKIIKDVRVKSATWGEFAPAPLTYINQERWNDGAPQANEDWRKGML